MKTNSDLLYDTGIDDPSIDHQEKTSIWAREISLFNHKKNNAFNARFFSEMSLLIGSGMDVHKSLDILEGGSSKERERRIIIMIKEAILNGLSLSEALESSDRFARYDTMTIAIGEETGELPKVLSSLALYYSKKMAQRKQIVGALAYPILVLFTTFLSLVFMLNYIIPMFEDVFERFDGNLPPLTRSIISFSDAFSEIIWLVLLVILSVAYFTYYWRKKIWYRAFSSALINRMPIIKDMTALTYKVRFCQTLALLIASRIHLQEALRLIKDVIGYYPMEKALGEIIVNISSGMSLSESMSPYRIFDRKMVAMTLVGEEVNKLEVVYEQLSNQYSTELDVKIKSMNSLLEPILIIFVGLMVGVILISMYLPIFQLGLSIGGQ